MLDAIEIDNSEKHVSVADVERLIAAAGDLSWQAVEPVGEGKDYRAGSLQGHHASALAMEDAIVHLSLIAAR